MNDKLLDFSKYENSKSKFRAKLSDRGGNITFSNSGKGGNKKYFTLGLDSFLTVLKDIKNNILEFQGHENYVEKEWRGLGSKHYTDKPANAQSTVQTKPMFATLSKIIMWANAYDLDNFNPEQNIELDSSKIENSIQKLNQLAEKFSHSNQIRSEVIPTENLKDKFADWLILKDGGSINYFNKNFASSREKLIQNLDHYNSLYSQDYSLDLFKLKKSEILEKINEIGKNVYNKTGLFFDYSQRTSHHMPRAILGKENYLVFLKEQITPIEKDTFNISIFHQDCTTANLKYSNQLVTRYISSLATKPFVLLSGLSGSGKTKLAQAFSQWICEGEKQYCIVPVGADWTNREPLLGYVNALDESQYIVPENGALQLLIDANNDQVKPYFLILDEMNLSHVERYFADFLSVMESKDKFKLHSSESNLNITAGDKFEKSIEVPNTLDWPKNLFVVGTVNIDETTYMFSPKVLDRANVIEFRINETEMGSYLNEATDVTDLNGEGKSMGESFVTIATEKTKANSNNLTTTLNNFFITLQEVGAEFGYRTASEIQTLFGQIDVVNPSFSEKENEKIDIAIMQKLLPKLHGSRSKLTPILKTLAVLCYQDNKDFTLEQKDKVFEMVKEDTRIVQYPISLEKITRMYHNVIANGFTSYAEA